MSANSLLTECLIVHCIMLNIHVSTFKREIGLSSGSTDHNHLQDLAYKQILGNNTAILRNARFASHKLLLVSDSIFPSQNPQRNHGLQAAIVESRGQVKIPTLILIPTISQHFTASTPISRLVVAPFSTTLLIFVDFNEDTVGIGCFACDDGIHYHWDQPKYISLYVVTLKRLSSSELGSYQNVQQVWEKLHSNFDLRSTTPPQSTKAWCSLTSETPSEEKCVVYKHYFKHVNCTNEEQCILIHSHLLFLHHVEVGFLNYPRWQISCHGIRQRSYYLQMFFPRENFFDVNLTAFLHPFNSNVWTCFVSITALVCLWLYKTQNEPISNVAIWQYSVLLEQSASAKQCVENRFWLITIMLLWVFSSMFLRQFYNSSLFSFMAANHEPMDYPRNIEELLVRQDFELLGPKKFSWGFKLMFDSWANRNQFLPKQLEAFYLSIIFKASYVADWYFTWFLRSLASGHYEPLESFEQDANTSLLRIVRNYKMVVNNVTFSKFAAMREDYEGRMNEMFFGPEILNQIVPKQEYLIRDRYYWSQDYASFFTFRFHNFLGRFVSSGLHELLTNQYHRLKEWRRWQGMIIPQGLGISNGYLYSRIFLVDRKERESKHEPTKLLAFTGTFVILGFMTGFAVVTFLHEVYQKLFFAIKKIWNHSRSVVSRAKNGCCLLNCLSKRKYDNCIDLELNANSSIDVSSIVLVKRNREKFVPVSRKEYLEFKSILQASLVSGKLKLGNCSLVDGRIQVNCGNDETVGFVMGVAAAADKGKKYRAIKFSPIG